MLKGCFLLLALESVFSINITEIYENGTIQRVAVSSNARYVFAVSVQYQFSISCSAVNTPSNKLTINSQVKSTFNATSKWETFCNDSACSNVIMTDPACATSPPCTASATDCSKRIVIQFSLTLSSKMHNATGGGEMPVEDALRIIIAVEKDIVLSNIASAQLVDGTLAITTSTQCPTGNTLIIYNDESVCVSSNARYVFAVSVQYQFSVSCSAVNTPSNKLEINSQVKRTFNATSKWETFCNDSACSNVIMTDPACATSPPCTASPTNCSKRIVIQFSLTLSSKMHNATGGGEMPVEDALRIIIAVEKDIVLSNIASAQLVDGTLAITKSTQCPTGNTLIIYNDESVCVPCGQGWYYNNTMMQCIPCPYGAYQDVEAQTSCKACPDNSVTYQKGSTNASDCIAYCPSGKFYNGVVTSPTQCQPCPRGTYRDNVGNNRFLTTCTPCPANTTTENTGSSTIASCSIPLCTSGQYISGGVCTNCSLDTFSEVIPTSTTTCVPCNTQYGTENVGTNNRTLCKLYCSAGTFVSGSQLTLLNQCQPCPRGTYRDNVGNNRFLTTCTPCPANTTTEITGSSTSASCSIPNCSSGKFISGGVCTPCPVDTYSEVTSPTSAVKCLSCNTTCGVCNALYGTENVRTNNRSLCKPSCPAGEQFNTFSLRCEKCAIGYFKVPSERFGACQSCETVNPGNVTSGTGATDGSQCNVPNCTLGYKIVGVKCELCPTGTYQNESRKATCYPCGPNLNTSGPGKTSCNDCQAKCVKGQQFNASEVGAEKCDPCPRRTYKDTDGNTVPCTACPAGKTTVGFGSISVTNCSQDVCPPGTYWTEQNLAIKCNTCPTGTYSDKEMQSLCTSCGDNGTTYDTGSMSNSSCIKKCLPGWGYHTDKKNCFICPIGQFNNKEGFNPNPCKLCPSGKTNTQSGSTSCTYDTSPRVDKRVDLTVSVVYRIAIDRCDDRTAMNLIIEQILKLLRAAFNNLKMLRYSTGRTFCSESCINIEQKTPSDLPRCKQLATGKRAITYEIELDVVFKNVSMYVIDQSDNNVEISVIEVISQLLELRKSLLTNTVVVVIYSGYGNITTMNLCPAGEHIINNTCIACSTGTKGTDGVSCVSCSKDTYQNETGQSSCKDCPPLTFYEGERATEIAACKSFCNENPTFCNRRGVCTLTGRRTATCSCYEDYTGDKCEANKVPSFVGGVVGGVVGGIVFVCVVVFLLVRWTRRKSKKSSGTIKTDEDDTYYHVHSNESRSSESVIRSVNAPQLPQRPNERRNTYLTPLVNPYLTPFEASNTHPIKTENAGSYYVELAEIDSFNPNAENMQGTPTQYENPVCKSPEAGGENLESQASYYNESSTDEHHNPNAENMQGTPTEYENTVSKSLEAVGENLESHASYYNKSSTDEQLRLYKQYQQIGAVSAYEQLQHQYDKLSAVQPEDTHAYTSL